MQIYSSKSLIVSARYINQRHNGDSLVFTTTSSTNSMLYVSKNLILRKHNFRPEFIDIIKLISVLVANSELPPHCWWESIQVWELKWDFLPDLQDKIPDLSTTGFYINFRELHDVMT